MNEAELQEFYINKQKIKELEERNTEIVANAGLRELDHGNYQEGRFIVEVSRNARFDPAKATELFPLGENGENFELYKAQVDSTLAKKHLSPADYERCQKEYPNNKVEIKMV